MAEAGGGQQNGGQGGGENQVNPAEARKFIEGYIHDPKLAQTMPDADVVAYHGRVRGAVDTAVQAAIKDRGDFSPEWRKAIAGDDTKALDTLSRFQTPKALWDSYSALRGKVSNGELKVITPFPASGTEEQKATWRADAGLPLTSKDYKVELPSGVVLGEEDQPFVDGFKEFAHGKNLSNEGVNTAIAWYVDQRAARMEKAAAADAVLRQEVDDKLHTQWGPEFRPSMSRIEGLFDAHLPAGSDMKERLMETVRTNVDFANLMAKVSFQLNPSPTNLLPGGENNIKGIEEWLQAGEKLMKTDRKAYDKSEYSDSAKYKQYSEAYKANTGKEWGRK